MLRGSIPASGNPKTPIKNWNSDQVTGAIRQVFFLWGFDPTLPLQNHTAVNAHGYVVGLSMDPVISRLFSEEQHIDRIAKWDEITKPPNSLAESVSGTEVNL
jgi:hypothetical protein